MSQPHLPALKTLEWLKSPTEYISIYNLKKSGKYDAARHLELQSSRRQMSTALEIIRRFKKEHVSASGKTKSKQKGVLLADDVGLGKTTVGAFVAGILAGYDFKVRVLAPNKPMARRWLEEIQSHQYALGSYGYKYKVSDRLKKLVGGSISVSTHRITAKKGKFDCDLLIVDEAHRAKNDGSQFAKALKKNKRKIGHILILTATPFSVAPSELKRMLEMVGAPSVVGNAIDSAASTLERLWHGDFADKSFADELFEECAAAIKAIGPFVIRHTVGALPDAERAFFGKAKVAKASTLEASDAQKEILVRMDRVLDLGKRTGVWRFARTNDPRFHVGWSQLCDVLDQVDENGKEKPAERSVQKRHIKKLRAALKKESVHPKVAATAADILRIVGDNERVVVFCDHHATAREVALFAAQQLHLKHPWPQSPNYSWLRSAYSSLCRAASDKALERRAKEGFLAWLTSDGVRAQVFSWLSHAPATQKDFLKEIRKIVPRTRRQTTNASESIAGHVTHLWKSILDKQSLLSSFADEELEHPGASLNCQRIVAATEFEGEETEFEDAFHGGGSPDVVLALFNSPFGPDVLIATDAMSEGYDLHRYCRFMIHHELDPSPMRTIQRNGRLRRVNCWAARTKLPLVISYPAFGGTRDKRLVDVMRERVKQFDLLLGGVGHDVGNEALDSESRRRQQDVIWAIEPKLKKLALKLAVVRR